MDRLSWVGRGGGVAVGIGHGVTRRIEDVESSLVRIMSHSHLLIFKCFLKF